MRVLMAAFLVWTLLSPQGRGGEAWPTHTACRDESLQVLYQSCDALQDFGLSVDQCLKQLKPNINIRFGIILREDIKELFLDIALFSKGLSILNFSYPICEVDLPKFSFCGRRKGARARSGPFQQKEDYNSVSKNEVGWQTASWLWVCSFDGLIH
ncbi:lymphocyte antigen 86 isoform X7 [Delphinapterus leucas]|uniref:Lymphocyte antigen 86 isoform X7 n=1 Tax=Delphinapterus leucas TaxID=9749 RepID=A0A2Y9PI29_DELLE|nr:lymphocyte antigen 86 isoform X7 [Delphinapterus leucas]